MLQTYFIFCVVFCLRVIIIHCIPLKDVELGFCGKMGTTFEVDEIAQEPEYDNYDERYKINQKIKSVNLGTIKYGKSNKLGY